MKKKWLILAVTMAMTVAQANTAMASIWIKDKTGWWYQHNNGSYTKGNWEKIRDRWYYFNSKGYLTTGWQEIKGVWYYFHSSGRMAANGWVSGKYYMGSDGAMLTNQPIDWHDEQ